MLRRFLLPGFFGLLLFALWQALRASGHLPSYKLPGASEILRAGWEERALLLRALGQTGFGAALGFVVSVSLGFLIALTLASRRWLGEMLSPWVTFFQMIPVVILAPLCVLLLDQGLPSIVTITFLICFFPVVANTAHGLASVDRGLLDLFAVCGATPRQTLLWLKIPAAMPSFLTGVRIAATVAPVGAITGDLFAGNKSGDAFGIGFLVQLYSGQFNIPAVYACALTSCLLGFFFVTAVYLASWLLLRRWHESYLPRH